MGKLSTTRAVCCSLRCSSGSSSNRSSSRGDAPLSQGTTATATVLCGNSNKNSSCCGKATGARETAATFALSKLHSNGGAAPKRYKTTAGASQTTYNPQPNDRAVATATATPRGAKTAEAPRAHAGAAGSISRAEENKRPTVA